VLARLDAQSSRNNLPPIRQRQMQGEGGSVQANGHQQPRRR
jgi:hypothetical protein